MQLDYKKKFSDLPIDIYIIHLLFFSFYLTYYYVLNGFMSEEKKITHILKPHHQLIHASSDLRRGNVFYSTPDYYLKLKNTAPNVSAFIQTEGIYNFSFFDQSNLKKIQKTIPTLLVDHDFFNMTKGSIIKGEALSAEDFFLGKPKAILTLGLVKKLFKTIDNLPTTIELNGRIFPIVGIWSFESDKSEENFNVILPLTAINILGVTQKTYMTRFILEGDSSKHLEILKTSIDKIQQDSGFSPTRPEYSIPQIQNSFQFEYIIKNQKVYIDLFLWLLFAILIARTIQVFKNIFLVNPDWIFFRKMGNVPMVEIYSELKKNIILFEVTLVLMSALLTSLSLLILNGLFNSPITTGWHIHLALPLYFVLGFLGVFFLKKQILNTNYYFKLD